MPSLPVILGLLASLVVGGLVGALAASGRSRAARDRLVAAETALASEREGKERAERELAAEREARQRVERELAAARERGGSAEAFLERARAELRDAFRALSAEALRGNREEFLKLADRDLEERRKGIESLLRPLSETLEKLERRTGEIEKAREGAYEGLREQIQGLLRATASLQERTTSLTSALKGSQARGRWGEIALENIVEIAGMQQHVDFDRQKETAGGRRPDLIVHLPEGRRIAVDAKVPFAAYMEAIEAPSEEARLAALDRHVAALRAHVRTLASREYAQALDGNVDLVVLFLPGDPFLAAAFERDPEIQVDALRDKVLLATPTTLLALLRTVAIYWQQKSLAENAERIAGVARELYERASLFGEHLAGVGKGLRAAVEAYNRASGSFLRRFLPMGRRLEEMKVAEQSARRLEAPEALEVAPREIAAPAEPGAEGPAPDRLA